MAEGTTPDGLHHPAPAKVQPRETEPHPVGVEGGTAEQVGLPPRDVHQHVGGGVTDDDQPVA